MKPIRVQQPKNRIEAAEFNLEESRFSNGSLRDSRLTNIMMTGTVIDDVNASDMKNINANLSALEIEGAQLPKQNCIATAHPSVSKPHNSPRCTPPIK